jgi:hypothetical protein
MDDWIIYSYMQIESTWQSKYIYGKRVESKEAHENLD